VVVIDAYYFVNKPSFKEKAFFLRSGRISKLPELIAVAGFVFDFLCIHPFRDGNGRVSRLLTLLLIYQQGYEVGRFISLERITEQTKEDYYRVLSESSKGWHNQKHDLMPWWNYFLGVIKAGYQELREKVDLSTQGDSMSSLIRQSALAHAQSFTVSDICKEHPTLNRELVKKVLFKMKKERIIKLSGSGRAARWRLSKKIES
jgi:Fic family protein